MLQWMSAYTEQMKEDGVRFLCRHAEHIGVPYKWSTIMNSLYYSIYDSGFMIGLDEQGQIRGILAYTYGTGKDRKADVTRIEVHLFYLEPEMRTGTRLVEVMEALVEREIELQEPIREIEFYSVPTDARRKLFGRIAEIRETSMHPCGLLDLYVTTPERVRQYVAKVRSCRSY